MPNLKKVFDDEVSQSNLGVSRSNLSGSPVEIVTPDDEEVIILKREVERLKAELATTHTMGGKVFQSLQREVENYNRVNRALGEFARENADLKSQLDEFKRLRDRSLRVRIRKIFAKIF